MPGIFSRMTGILEKMSGIPEKCATSITLGSCPRCRGIWHHYAVDRKACLVAQISEDQRQTGRGTCECCRDKSVSLVYGIPAGCMGLRQHPPADGQLSWKYPEVFTVAPHTSDSARGGVMAGRHLCFCRCSRPPVLAIY